MPDLRGECAITKFGRRENNAQSLCYSWSKDFLEAGKKRLAGGAERQASSGEVKYFGQQTQVLKEAVADLTVKDWLLKQSVIADGGDAI